MSRIGKKPIEIPPGVEVNIEGQRITVKGQRGELSREIPPEIKVKSQGGQILLSPQIENKPRTTFQDKGLTKQAIQKVVRGKKTKAFWGLSRSLVSNIVKGVTEGFEKKLEIEGLGFKAQIVGNDLELFVGFAHPIKIKAPENIKFSVEKNTITVSGSDLEKISQIAAKIRKVKPPEPYKGKGIRYLGEQIRRKVGKKAATATT